MSDPLSWALGIFAKQGISKLLDSRGKDLSTKLQAESTKWAKSVEADFPDLPADNLAQAFFTQEPGAKTGTARTRLTKAIEEKRIPTEDEWFNALTERADEIRVLTRNDSVQFFKASRERTNPLLQNLANRFHLACTGHQDFFQATAYSLLTELLERQKAIEESLAQNSKSSGPLLKFPEVAKGSVQYAERLKCGEVAGYLWGDPAFAQGHYDVMQREVIKEAQAIPDLHEDLLAAADLFPCFHTLPPPENFWRKSERYLESVGVLNVQFHCDVPIGNEGGRTAYFNVLPTRGEKLYDPTLSVGEADARYDLRIGTDDDKPMRLEIPPAGTTLLPLRVTLSLEARHQGWMAADSRAAFLLRAGQAFGKYLKGMIKGIELRIEPLDGENWAQPLPVRLTGNAEQIQFTTINVDDFLRRWSRIQQVGEERVKERLYAPES